MDISRSFLCTVMHPGLFPGPITDPGNPLRVKMLIEVGAEDLIIRAPAASANGKIMGTEPLAKIDRVTIECLTGSAQRIEIMRRSLLRMALVGGIVLVFALFIRAYPIGISTLMALAVAAFIGLLNFLLNGGLGRKQNVIRFKFTPSEHGRSFYLEVPPTQELGLHHALLAAGLSLEEPGTNQQVWTCENCGTVVDATATICPRCGTEQVWTCDNCGAVVDATTTICPRCGAEFED